jgi:hypothetical protein
VYKVKFIIDDLKLSSDAPSQKTPLSLAEECAIRLNVSPPPGKTLKRLVANTQFQASKSAEVDLLLNGELKLGTSSLGYVREISKHGEEVFEKMIPVHLDTKYPSKGGAEAMPELSCGEAKIIGFDYTFTAKRKSEKESFQVGISNEKTLEIVAELGNCKDS